MGAGGFERPKFDLRDFERSSFPSFATEKLDFGHHGFGEVGAFLRRKYGANINRNPNAQTLLGLGCFWCKQSTWLGFCRGGVKFWVVFFFCFLYATHFVSNLSWWNKKSTTSSERLQALLWKFPTFVFGGNFFQTSLFWGSKNQQSGHQPLTVLYFFGVYNISDSV